MSWMPFEWMSWEDWAGNFCYLILAFSYLVTNIYWLRVLAIVALGFEGIYFYYGSQPPLWVGIAWAAVFVGINVIQLVILTRERMSVRFNEQEEALRRGLFAGVESLQLHRLLKNGHWQNIPAGMRLTTEGQVVNDFCVIASGCAKVEVGSRLISVLQPGALVGEMSLLTGENASATVTTLSPCRVFRVNKQKLQSLFGKNQDFRSELVNVIGRNLSQKLRLTSENSGVVMAMTGFTPLSRTVELRVYP
jgi:CRP-like cAMP-binding protein